MGGRWVVRVWGGCGVEERRCGGVCDGWVGSYLNLPQIIECTCTTIKCFIIQYAIYFSPYAIGTSNYFTCYPPKKPTPL